MKNEKYKMKNALVFTFRMGMRRKTFKPRHFAIDTLRFAICILLSAYCVSFSGCGGCNQTAPSQTQIRPDASEQHGEKMLASALDNLQEDFASADILPQIFQRLSEGSRPQSDAAFDPLLASCPEPEMLRHIIDRLNQWIRTEPASADWKADPMTASLPKPYSELPQIKDLGRMEFSRLDGYALQEAVWYRNVSRWARGDILDDLQRACSLFDWTVRNIELEPDGPGRVPQFAWETLLLGHGTVEERSEAFILLLRQAEIDAAALALEERAEKNKPLRLWCVGVLIENNVYLFDPLLGLPIPAPGGVTREKNGLAIRPATLAQCAADDKLLRRMDASESQPYGVKAADLARVMALFAASSSELSQRMKRLETRMTGEKKLALTASPTAAAEHWKASPGIVAARLWAQPYETLWRRGRLSRRDALVWLAQTTLPFYVTPSAPLHQGRMLYFRGNFVGENGAMQCYLQARPSNEQLRASSADVNEKFMSIRGRQDATYWCGLIAFQRGKYADAVDYFYNRTLRSDPGSPWTTGAQYNLARTYEASGETQRAVLQYGGNAASPGYHGDLLRAKWLQEFKAEGGTGK
jgi:hypothetical protein